MKKNYWSLQCQSIEIVNNEVYILARKTNSIFGYNVVTEELDFYGTIRNGVECYLASVLVDNKIYYVPYYGEKIYIFDINTKKIETMKIEFSNMLIKDNGYRIAVANKNNIYFLGGFGEAKILKIETDTGCMKCTNQWSEEFNRLFGKSAWFMPHTNVCVCDDCIWVCLNCSDTVLQYSMENDFYKIWKVGNLDIQYTTINYDGKFFWLTGDRQVIVRWDNFSNEIIEFSEFPEGFKYKIKSSIDWTGMFYDGKIIQDKIYYAPLNSNMFIVLDTKLGNIEKVMEISSDLFCFHFSFLPSNKIYAELYVSTLFNKKKSYYIDSNGKNQEYSISGENVNFHRLKKDSYNSYDFLGELESFPGILPIYIEKISSMIKEEDYKNKKNIGTEIFTILERG